MSSSITCPVCDAAFIYRAEAEPGAVLICPICGAKIEVAAAAPELRVRKLPQEPEAEIVERIDNFARLRGYVFNEDRELYVKGLLAKKERYGDFFCPCRYNNDPENLCPCLDARSNRVRKEGRCLCGLFSLPARDAGSR